ncbi:MAG: carbohydrate kinase family protein [Candidatus Aenigmatarchaeota archaeon]
MRALVVGSALIDIVCKFEDNVKVSKGKLILNLGSKYNLELIEFSVGGSALNVACTLSNLGNEVYLVSRVGKDLYANYILDFLKKHNVKSYISYDKESTGFSVILMKDGEKIVLASKGASENLEANDIKEEFVKNSDVIIATSCGKNSYEIYKKLFELSKKYNKFFVFNPSISVIRKEKRLLNIFKNAELIILNDEEAKEITNSKNINKAAKVLLKHFKRVIITLGKKGSVYYDLNSRIKQKAFNVKVVSTLGAGDSFTAGFVHYYFRFRNVEQALKFASAVAALNVMSFGSVVEAKEYEVLEFMRKFKQ